MPDFLTFTTGRSGEQYLVESADGRRLVENSSCGQCCTSTCAVIRRYDRCAPNSPILAQCINQPDHIWMCDPQVCNGETIHFLNACYRPTSTVLPPDQLPAGDTLILPGSPVFPECVSGCGDPRCTVCDLYYLATPCKGSTCTFPVFVPIILVTGCGLVGMSANGCCQVIKPGQTYTRAQVDATPGAVIDGAPSLGLDCCDCVAGCLGHVQVAYVDCATGANRTTGPCCCSNTYIETLTVSSAVVIRFEDFGAGDDGDVDTSTFVGTLTRQVVNGAVISQTGSIRGTQTHTDGQPANDLGEYVPSWWWACGGPPPIWSLFDLPPYNIRAPSWGLGPYDNILCQADQVTQPQPGVSVMSYSSVTCTSALSGGHTTIRIPTQSSPRVEWTIRGTWTISGQGQCGGGCGGGGVTPIVFPGQIPIAFGFL